MSRRRRNLPERNATEDAFHVHSALVTAEVTLPWLRDNPQWRLLRMDAYETFYNLFTESAGAK